MWVSEERDSTVPAPPQQWAMEKAGNGKWNDNSGMRTDFVGKYMLVHFCLEFKVLKYTHFWVREGLGLESHALSTSW